MFSMKYLIQINYKSGLSLKIWFKDFKVIKRGGDISSIEWKEASSRKSIFYIGIDDIESIVQIKKRRAFFWL